MEFGFSAEDELFRDEVRTWLAEHLVGEYAALGTGGDMGEGAELEVRKSRQQLRFAAEYRLLVAEAQARRLDREPVVRQRPADAYLQKS